MRGKVLLLSAIFAVMAMSASALSISLQYPFGANQVIIEENGGVVTLTIVAPEEDEIADPYVATAPLGLALDASSKSIEFEYTATATFIYVVRNGSETKKVFIK